ncbi:invasion associated locus B family protein [Halocynthiibacter sp. C4]|uniref:invasion associated locus B family protein n=1 Tax=Halocynthiibacter sp. C4 TaxID=2992758 RepID=UPI00237AAC7A|nr:invasion associated locus B family protein [Halocynthiibacter sp. C4]MDE0591502.1 invasion associated locus B family protein [Halocynthiibacter sp. C4]
MTIITRLALAATVALSPLTAFSQDAETTEEAPVEAATDVVNGSAFGDWIVDCQALTAKRTACRLIQEQSLRETGELVARFVAVPVEDGAILLAQVPMGVYLPGGAVYRFTENEEVEQRDMIWQRCAADICEAAAPLDDDELAIFAEHDSLLFGFRPTADGEPVILNVDISSFAEAIAALRANNS